jgi:hypothetical protein
MSATYIDELPEGVRALVLKKFGGDKHTPQSMDSDSLAAHVETTWLSAFSTLRPFVEELWKRFEELKAGETIAGCKTRKEYCERILHRTPRAVRYMLAGGNPVSKRLAGETVSPVTCSTGKRVYDSVEDMRSESSGPFAPINCRQCGGFHFDNRQNRDNPSALVQSFALISNREIVQPKKDPDAFAALERQVAAARDLQRAFESKFVKVDRSKIPNRYHLTLQNLTEEQIESLVYESSRCKWWTDLAD